MEAKALREALSKMYSRLNYQQFCEYMNFNAKYDERYWRDFQKFVDAVSTFDNANLQKIIDFGKTEP